MLRRLIGENIRLNLRLEGRPGIRADGGQIDQILVNLVVNARDAMPSGGTVTVETGNFDFEEPYALEHFDVMPGPYVLLAVSDTGVGMDRSTRQHVFEPFFTTKEVGKARASVWPRSTGHRQQAGGHIWLYSEPGLGSSFKLYFPRVDEAADIEVRADPSSGRGQRSADPRRRGRGGGPGPSVASWVGLVTMSTAPRTAIPVGPRGARALRRGRVRRRHASRIRHGAGGGRLAQLPATGVVLLSGYTAETLDLAALLERGVVFVDKPFSTERLLAAVGGVLRPSD